MGWWSGEKVQTRAGRENEVTTFVLDTLRNIGHIHLRTRLNPNGYDQLVRLTWPIRQIDMTFRQAELSIEVRSKWQKLVNSDKSPWSYPFDYQIKTCPFKVNTYFIDQNNETNTNYGHCPYGNSLAIYKEYKKIKCWSTNLPWTNRPKSKVHTCCPSNTSWAWLSWFFTEESPIWKRDC